MAAVIEHAACVDCALWVANRDDSSASDEWRAWRDGLEERAARGDEHALWALYVIGFGWVGDPSGFSWTSCDVCRAPYGGDRHLVAVIEPKDDAWRTR